MGKETSKFRTGEVKITTVKHSTYTNEDIYEASFKNEHYHVWAQGWEIPSLLRALAMEIEDAK